MTLFHLVGGIKKNMSKRFTLGGAEGQGPGYLWVPPSCFSPPNSPSPTTDGGGGDGEAASSPLHDPKVSPKLKKKKPNSEIL